MNEVIVLKFEPQKLTKNNDKNKKPKKWPIYYHSLLCAFFIENDLLKRFIFKIRENFKKSNFNVVETGNKTYLIFDSNFKSISC